MKDEHTYGTKMARKGRTKVMYKGTFICIQTLLGKTSCRCNSGAIWRATLGAIFWQFFWETFEAVLIATFWTILLILLKAILT